MIRTPYLFVVDIIYSAPVHGFPAIFRISPREAAAAVSVSVIIKGFTPYWQSDHRFTNIPLSDTTLIHARSAALKSLEQ
jgi:hypothetical protein